MGRFFTAKDKRVMGIVQGVDPAGMHADHIVPHSRGGKTDVLNGQLLSPEANMAKGASHIELREWQSEFMAKWDNRVAGQPFLLCAIPGSGKTVATLKAVYEWMGFGSDRKVVIVVPTSNLRTQWKEAAAAFGIQLQTVEFSGSYRDDYQGCVVTYAYVAGNSSGLRCLAAAAPSMVVFDEMHHCGDESSWGAAVEVAFEAYRERLMLSGTPFRTDGTRIPFVTYDKDGFSAPDFSYDYPNALTDGVVRWLAFTYQHGDVTIEKNGADVTLAVRSDAPQDTLSESLRHALNPRGEFIESMIADAHAKLTAVRSRIPDAAAMAACIDTIHAQRVAEVIMRVTGCKPMVVVSDSEAATGTVDAFEKASSEWIVAVRQVSEGTDIKRLQVLCYFTTQTTELFFRQLVGRVSRVRGIDDPEAYVFIPSDPRLIACARNIENAQTQALKDVVEENEREWRETGVTEFAASLFVSSQSHGIELVMIGNAEYTTTQATAIAEIAAKTGTTQETAAKFYAAYPHAVSGSHANAPAEPPIVLEDQQRRLRKQCHNLAIALSKTIDCEVWEVHNRFSPPQKDMTVTQLEGKLKQIRAWLREAKQS